MQGLEKWTNLPKATQQISHAIQLQTQVDRKACAFNH